jgi:hypothetical protein
MRITYSKPTHGEILVHRLVAYQKFGDQIFDPGLVVRHLDGNQRNNCPSNLEMGTMSQNMLDRPAEVRLAHAKKAARARRSLSDAQVAQLRADHAAGIPYSRLMKKYGLAKSTVSYIINRITYPDD